MSDSRRWPIAVGALVLLAGGLWSWAGRETETVEVVEVRGEAEVGGAGPRGVPVPGALRPRSERASISGAVKDEQGRAIAGATVCARVESRLIATSDARERRCATSGRDGHYRIDELFGVRHRVLASAPGYVGGGHRRGEGARRRETIELRPASEVRDVDIVLVGGGVEIRGAVRDLSGGAVEGAQVLAESSLGFTGEDGAFSLWVQPGVARLYASAEGYTSGFEEGAAPGHAFAVYLTPESVLIGKVVRAGSGAPIAGARVTAEAGGDNWSGAVAFTDASGGFRLDGLAPGPYKARAEADDALGLATEQVMLGLGETSAPIVIEAHPAFYVEGTVTIAGGEVCEHGFVDLRDRERGLRARLEAEGDGVVRGRGVLPGEYAAQVTCEGFVTAPSYPQVSLGDRSVSGLRWEVTPGRAIRGVVVEAGGKPAAGVEVGAEPRAEPGAARVQQTGLVKGMTDAQGRFELVGLLPGGYQLRLGSSYSSPRALPTAPIDVSVAEGKDLEGVRVVLPATGTVRGRVVDEHGAAVARVMVALVGEVERQYANAGDDGSFTLPAVAAGDYRAMAERDGERLRSPGRGDDEPQGERVQVRVGGVEEVKIVVASATGELTGIVRGADGGPVADAFIDAARESDSAAAAGGAALRETRWSSLYGTPHMTDLDGRFTLTGLGEGVYTVRAHRRGGGEGVAEHARPGTEVVVTIAEVGRMSGTVAVRGGGAPESFTVELSAPATGFRRGDRFYRTGGAWSLAELPDGEYRLKVDAGEGEAELAVKMVGGADTTGVRVELSPKVTVRGTVVDLAGAPVPGMRVNLGGLDLEEVEGARNITDEAGRYEVLHVPTGVVQAIVLPRNITDPEWDGAFFAVKVEASGPSVELAPIRLSRRRVKEGEARGDLGYQLREDEAGADPLARKLIVAVVRPGGPAAAAGLKPGDEIVRFDGQMVSGGDGYLLRTLAVVPVGAVVTLGLASGADVRITAGEQP